MQLPLQQKLCSSMQIFVWEDMLRVFAKNQKGGVQMKMRKTLVATALFPIILA